MNGAVVWLTGLPASGKTTLAAAIQATLARRRVASVVLDGDELHPLLGVNGHESADRDEFYARLAALAALVARQDLVVLVPATAHRRAYRSAARAAAPRFVEVFVATPLAECAARDPKGLYARARAGAAPTLPGSGVTYEAPDAPEVVAAGGLDAAAVARVVALIVDGELPRSGLPITPG